MFKKYVVTCVDPWSGKIIYGDLPACKFRAKRWARKNAKEVGGEWGIAPADEAIYGDKKEK